MAEETVGIVGAGILGLAVGREITLRRPGTRVVVFEKEDSIGAHQTGHNSGVVHAGIYYAPGSLKARLCTRGRSLLKEYCAGHGLPYEECGKLVVAVTPEEVPRLERLADLARANGVPGLRKLTAGGITEVEPHAGGLVALHSPRTAITDYVRIAEGFGRDIVAAGGEILLGRRVSAVDREGGGLRVTAGGRIESVDRLVVCAGLHADRVGRLLSDTAEPRIIPFRGEYMRVRPSKADLVRGMIYPVPDPRYPFLGVHFTRRIDGGVEVGPNAVLATAREGYHRWRVDPAELLRIASWPGSARMAVRHWRTGLRELRGSLSVRAYMRAARHYVPGIGPGDVVRA
ncbi:L-2-hydroxyglutarate oxidase, partial [Streptomyces alkaliphilus]